VSCPCCKGPDPSVPIGAGMLICFRCFVRLMYPGVLPPRPPGDTKEGRR
jgi:hypothetical protein